MKTQLIIFATLLFYFATLTSFAQLPQKPEDISPLLVGESMPEMFLANADAKRTELKQLFKEKPTVLVFYRGGWCPFCSQHLSALGEASDEIIKMGYQIIAISPDQPSLLKQTGEKGKLSYQLLSDSSGLFSQAVGIAFQAPDNYIKTIEQVSGGSNKTSLPVPALFILDKQGAILFEHINPNYKSRISLKLLLAVLQGLN